MTNRRKGPGLREGRKQPEVGCEEMRYFSLRKTRIILGVTPCQPRNTKWKHSISFFCPFSPFFLQKQLNSYFSPFKKTQKDKLLSDAGLLHHHIIVKRTSDPRGRAIVREWNLVLSAFRKHSPEVFMPLTSYQTPWGLGLYNGNYFPFKVGLRICKTFKERNYLNIKN